MYQRILKDIIKDKIGSGKAIIIVGARQVGETTLINEILEGKEYLVLDADDPSIRQLLLNPIAEEIRKQNIYKETFARMYFWRTKQQQEIDFIEEKHRMLIL